MTKPAALHSFFSGFGLTAYPETDQAVLKREAPLPYLTYTPVIDSWSGGPVAITVNLWYNTTSEAIPNAKAQEIADTLPKYVPCDGGAILLERGSPWCQSVADQTDTSIKRRYINITATFLTLN